MTAILANSRLAIVLLIFIGTYFSFSDHLYDVVYDWLNPWSSLMKALPYILATITFVVSWHFHHAKPAWASLIITFVAYCANTELYYQGMFTLTMLLILPAWVFLLSFLPEKPLPSLGAFMQLLLLLAPLLFCGLAIYWYPQAYLSWLTYEPPWLFSPSIEPIARYLPYSIFILAIQGTVALSLIVMFVRYRQQQDMYLLITLLMLSWALYGPLKPLELTLTFNLLLIAWLLAILIYGHNLAYLDELTGLPGRRALNQMLAKLGKKSVVAMLDVDHFKKFNDTYGHDVGDDVLKMVASRIRQVKGGKAFRYGGEEFTILFPNTTIDVAHSAADDVRQAVEDSSLRLRSKHRPKNPKKGTKLRGSGPSKNTKAVSVTISIGLAENTVDEPLKEADKKLYDAKQLGRNQVCV